MRIAKARIIAFILFVIGSFALPVFAGETVAVQRILGVKAYLAESQSVLRDYKWLETTVIGMTGESEQYSTKQQCSHAADGSVRKVPLNKTAPEEYSFGVIFTEEIKSKDVAGYLKDAVNLIHQYIPLKPNGIQSVIETGKLSFGETDPDKQGRLTIRDFLYRGDSIDLDIELENNHPVSLKIHSFLPTKGDPVTISVTFGSLYGTATFVREALLMVKGKKLKITIQNTEFARVTPM